MKKALLVIDMQNVCVGKTHAKMFSYENDKLIKNINERIATYPTDHIIYICNIMKDNFINKFAPFKAYEGSHEVQLVEDLMVVNTQIVKKYKGDAFSNPQLDELLRNKQIDALELVGVDGGGCVAQTAYGAIKLGYNVYITKSSIGTTFKNQAKKHTKNLVKMGVYFSE